MIGYCQWENQWFGLPWGTHGYPDAGPKAPASPAPAPPSPVPAAPTLPVMQVTSTQAAAQLVPEWQFGTWSVGILMVLLWNYNWSTHTMVFYGFKTIYLTICFSFGLFMFFSGWHPQKSQCILVFCGMKIRDYHQWNGLRVKFTKPILFYKKCNLLLHIVIYIYMHILYIYILTLYKPQQWIFSIWWWSSSLIFLQIHRQAAVPVNAQMKDKATLQSMQWSVMVTLW